MSSDSAQPAGAGTALSHLPADRLLRRHYIRLKLQRDRIIKTPEGSRRVVDAERWNHALQHAIEVFQSRQAKSYRVDYDDELPISAYREKIIELLHNRQVIIVCGETGSGKSTQLPKMCLEAGLGKFGWIGHTQPRRIAARSIAKRVAEELGSQLGEVVGFKVRFNDQTKPESLIKLMTDGVLLTEIQRDRFLDSYDCIIVDEAHERSLNIDLLMAYLQRLLTKRPELRIIITSATIDAERFSEHFVDAIGPAPIVHVSGRSYPVEIRYRGALDSLSRSVNDSDGFEDASLMSRFCEAIDELFQDGRGDILAFFPTERDIRDAAKHLRGHLTQQRGLHEVEVLPLYARLTEAEQQRVFQPHSKIRIILATNVAESSLTVPGIRYVIDAGTARVSRFASKSKVQRLPIEPIPQASANQRSGRCGRLGPGIAIRLYDEQDFLSRPLFATPEIRRSDLAATIVHTKSLGIEDFEGLPWLDAPRPDAVREGMQVLRELGAIDDQDRLTSIGKRLARWPVDPRIGRIIIEAEKNGCLNDILIIASALETQDPRVRPPEKAAAADEAHAKFRDPASDFVAYLRIWDFYQSLREQLGRARLEKALQQNFLSNVRMREWADVHRQLLEQCKESKIPLGKRALHLLPLENDVTESNAGYAGRRNEKAGSFELKKGELPAGYDRVHLSLLAGLLSGIAMMEDTGKYRAAQGLEVVLWPGSGIRGSKPKWIVAAERIETSLRYARTAARIEMEWIERSAVHLIKYSYDEAHFSRKQGSAMVMRRGTLFGLPVSPRVAVPLAPLRPDLARQLLIEHGLGEEELVSRAKFWEHNRNLLSEIRNLAAKTRRRDLIVDPQRLIAFYEARIPNDVIDRASLERWDRSLNAAAGIQRKENSPYLTWDDILLPIDRGTVDMQFPDRVSLGVTQLPLKYRFEPGHEEDGVSVAVPRSIVHQLHSERLEWLVPGLMEEKLTQLIKSLPKRLRRQLVPIPDTVQTILPEMIRQAAAQAPFWKSLCDLLSRQLNERVEKADFDLTILPDHLRFRIELLDEQGKIVGTSRELADLQKIEGRATDSLTHSVSSSSGYSWNRCKMDTWDIDALPESIIENRSGVRVESFPTIIVVDGNIRTIAIDHRLLANQLLRVSTIRLWHRIDRKEIRSHIQYLPQFSTSSLGLSDRYSSDSLREILGDLVARLSFVDRNWNMESLEKGLRTKLDFELLRLKRLERISLSAAEIARWLPKLADANHRLRGLLERAPASWGTSLEQIREQAKSILDPSFVWNTPWCIAKDFPRYLQSLAIRAERLRSGGLAKDQSTENIAKVFWVDYVDKLKAIQPPPSTWQSLQMQGKEVLGASTLYATDPLSEYRWAIEELRVSLHSQQLGTRISISPKKLEKMREALERSGLSS